ncbi:MAG TPA: LuxR C-terminal-related transcriptional regulator [Chloroflexia bacterium]|jgi:LuxR family maltose regulon positive regulatory protein
MPALTLLQAPQPPPIERILANMLNALAALKAGKQGRNVALVLEDYHVITTPAIHMALAWLLDYLPETLHLMIVTRADPALPLARLRARGDLTEIHAEDLRFNADEAAAFLNEVMGLALTPVDVAALELRTEGWIAGLQLAALALRDHRDPTSFVRTFTGNNRYIVDYLAAEVFVRQSAQVQNFLLRTAILDRMCGPLCDAVLGIPGAEQGRVDEEGTTLTVPEPPSPGNAPSQNMLEQLERNNMFVVPLDEERNWYRYHHLLGDVLRQRLARGVSPEDMAGLHERASVWCESQGLVTEAIQHALMMSDGLRAATLLERHALGIIVGGQVQTALDWLSRLPESLLLVRPRLCIYHALALLFANQMPAAEARVQDAERCIKPDTTPAEAQEIQGLAAAIRANMALYSGDLAACVAYGEQVLSLLPETEVIARTTAHSHVARAFRVTGDVTLASERRVVSAIGPIRATGSLLGTLAVLGSLARLQEMQGRLRSAAATYRQMDQLFTVPDDLRGLHGSAAYDVGLGDLHREWNELDAAGAYLARAMELLPGRVTVDAGDLFRGYTALARLQHARGEHRRAQETLAAFQDLARQRGLLPHLVKGVAAVRAQLALAAGHLSEALTWADESGLHKDDELSYLRETEYLVLARVWVARAGSDTSSDLLIHTLYMLDRLMADAIAKERGASVLEILIVRALALRAQGNIPHALATLVRALTMAAPEGYVRRFVDEDPAMRSLLQAVDLRAVPGGVSYVPYLLGAFAPHRAATGQEVVEHVGIVPTHAATRSSRNMLPEPLSGRELEVLRLIADGCSNAEVADALVIALSTVKTHTNSIFSKLGTTSRTQAVARARNLGLV